MKRSELYDKLIAAIESRDEHPVVELGNTVLNEAVLFVQSTDNTTCYQLVDRDDRNNTSTLLREYGAGSVDIAHETGAGWGVVLHLVEHVYCELVALVLDELHTKGV